MTRSYKGRHPWFLAAGWMLMALLVLLAGCGRGRILPPDMSGELVVGIRNSPTTYYTDRNGDPKGFEYDMVARFAEQNGWRLRLVQLNDLEALLDHVNRGQVNLAAAGLTSTDSRRLRVSFGPPYSEIKEWVVCRSGISQPRNLGDMATRSDLRLEVLVGSSHADFLASLQKGEHPGLRWSEMRLASPEDLLQRVDAGLADCTVADSDSLALAHNFHPNLQDAFVLRDKLEQAWAMAQGVDVAFSRKLSKFFRQMEKSGELARLRERYFGHVTRLADADVMGILQRRETQLPALTAHFREAQQVTGIDWRFLAAVAYQESQWDIHAVSPTGVRGIMMLTEDTADHLGVDNRLDARQSILGGARYLAQLRDALPGSIQEPDRTWFALAAYNIGPGHLEDARRLAKKLGRNPDQWVDMKDTLPLLARSRHNQGLRHGFARGGEARALAENVRIYYDILTRYEKPYRDSWVFD